MSAEHNICDALVLLLFLGFIFLDICKENGKRYFKCPLSGFTQHVLHVFSEFSQHYVDHNH
jgi:hypothetical protein